jgi:hypothetical protein
MCSIKTSSNTVREASAHRYKQTTRDAKLTLATTTWCSEVRTDSSKFSLSGGRHIGCKAVGAQYQQARGIDGGSEAETWIPNYR